MSKIVFFCIPAHGHTNPTLGVVRELVSRGHQVFYYSYNMMRSKIEAAGAAFISCDDYDMEQKLTPGDAARIAKDLAFSTKILVDTTLALDEQIRADLQTLQPDCIVADSMAVWGKAAAMKFGIPFVSSTTTFAFNQHSARIMKQGLGDLFRMIFAMPKVNQQIKRLQAQGYPVNSILDIIQNDDATHTVVYTSPEFQPCSDTFSDKYAFVGPSIRPATGTVEKTRPILIYLSMGTVNNDMLPLYRRCIDGLAGTGHQVILSVGDQVPLDAFGTLPEHITVHAQVDQIAVLEQADIFITHCGMNSVSEALYFGVPLVLLPQTTEQQGVAARVLELGAGIRPKKADAASITSAVNTILATPGYKASAEGISDSFRRCAGAKAAADKILQVCQGG